MLPMILWATLPFGNTTLVAGGSTKKILITPRPDRIAPMINGSVSSPTTPRTLMGRRRKDSTIEKIPISKKMTPATRSADIFFKKPHITVCSFKDSVLKRADSYLSALNNLVTSDGLFNSSSQTIIHHSFSARSSDI